MLWAVTSYFNPTGSKRRIANYHAFRAALECPLLAVEWSRDRRFELYERDADLLVRIDGGDLMWQKERLLNIGIERLPASCRQVAWLDCDIVLERPDWVAEAIRQLADHALVQLFDRAIYLAATPLGEVGQAGDLRSAPREIERIGLMSTSPRDVLDATALATDDVDVYRRMPSKGFAWAANRELLEKHPMFDAWVVGGGNTAYVYAALGAADRVVRGHGLGAPHQAHYLPRAEALAAEVGGRVGFVAGTVFHLWHGSLADRHYRSRLELLAQHDFDPARSLRKARSGAWCWNEVPAGLPRSVQSYFEARKEGG
ncbi:MAG: hypothetical protein KJZ83_15865 [Burkholderiaceae bacterium]|nr:hypothetical protein [Burkholderiaceae bacterium]